MIPYLHILMDEVYSRFLEELTPEDWGQCEPESRQEFVHESDKFSEEVALSVKLMAPGQELFILDPDEMVRFSNQNNEAEKI